MNRATPGLPPQLRRARRLGWAFVAGFGLLVVLSFRTLDLRWSGLFSGDGALRMARFLAELLQPSTDPRFLAQLVPAALETLAMSAVGTLLATAAGLALALPASAAFRPQRRSWWRRPSRWLLNALRSVPELMWAALLLIAAGLGPLAGTLALALHTTGVLGRLFAEAIDNAPPAAAQALRLRGIAEGRVFFYSVLPQVGPQLLSYAMYRWENNIRAAAVLGVVGAGGLGQLLSFYLGLFQMPQASAVVAAVVLLVLLVDWGSDRARRILTR